MRYLMQLLEYCMRHDVLHGDLSSIGSHSVMPPMQASCHAANCCATTISTCLYQTACCQSFSSCIPAPLLYFTCNPFVPHPHPSSTLPEPHLYPTCTPCILRETPLYPNWSPPTPCLAVCSYTHMVEGQVVSHCKWCFVGWECTGKLYFSP